MQHHVLAPHHGAVALACVDAAGSSALVHQGTGADSTRPSNAAFSAVAFVEKNPAWDMGARTMLGSP